MVNPALSTLFFLQVAVILLGCRVAGAVARRFGQPEAVGQMIAGILLGPSLLGAISPHVHGVLFPEGSKQALHVMAQLGLAFSMFLVGLEFRTDLFRTRMRAAAAIAAAGMVVPFAVGMGIAAWLYTRQDMFGPGVARLEAMLFLGAAMSITAFPMMARMIAERGLSSSSIGTLLLAAGAMDDALAWCVLAALFGLMGGSWWLGGVALGGGLAFVAALVLLVRPLLARLGAANGASGGAPLGAPISTGTLSLVLALLAGACWFTDSVGVHAVFGAFVLGVSVPRGALSANLLRMLMPVVTVLLLPMYFVNSGMNTRIGLLDSWGAWGVTVVIVLGACGGKLLACAGAARMSGEGRRESVAIGAMMNARGLMELVILNIGLDRGLITPTLFTAGVLMAVITTLMATPMFDAAYRVRIRRDTRDSRDAGGGTLPASRVGGAVAEKDEGAAVR